MSTKGKAFEGPTPQEVIMVEDTTEEKDHDIAMNEEKSNGKAFFKDRLMQQDSKPSGEFSLESVHVSKDQ